ncbi:apolipoprotein D-like [Dreissena polymorpha]|uniref:Lipocalin/cytosolic fatty-acid binding domain-containing protein n=1 Tax=Dreissena polymorpha TaxID=45954 RepID=A0A9D4HQI1_DREPO|nr:apolipoprotein D-like [Dreissena polymorpha]KAH3727749.1 hypothetical protein DPMN_053692 [Dreissena polymorpha]
MFAYLFCLAAIATVGNGFLLDTVFGAPPRTVQSLDLNKYLGRWFQMYASQSVITLWENNAFCVTADYELGSSGNVTVLNSERLQNATGPLKVIHGYATPTGEPGKFTVKLEMVPIAAPYWVLKLGPATYGETGQYHYSVVSDNVRGTLFVLARDPETFRRDYATEVEEFLKSAGFTHFYNKYIITYHGMDCVYNANHH